jgi:formamidopyrimidine-DNA glycosylase
VSVKASPFNLRKSLGPGAKKTKTMKVKSFSRWGKRLFINLNKESAFFDISLGMTGNLRIESGKPKKRKHDHIVVTFASEKRLVYNDPRRFGWFEYLNEEKDLIGWDPLLSSKRDFSKIVENGQKLEKNIYSFLMDQKYVVGLGNIYVQEILFRAKVSPFRKTKNCSSKDFNEIKKGISFILNKALGHGGSTILSYQNAEGDSGSFQKKLKVYGKKKGQPCKICKSPIVHIMQARSISYCKHCQV